MIRVLVVALAITISPNFAYAEGMEKAWEDNAMETPFLLAEYSDWEIYHVDVNNMDYLHNQNWRCRYVNVVGDHAIQVTWRKSRCPMTIYYNPFTGEARDHSKGHPHYQK